MKAMLHIRSSFDGYSMFILNDNKELIFFTKYYFKSHTHKKEELQSSIIENTKQLIEFAQKNGITSFGVKVKGVLHSSPLNIGLLNEGGIDVLYIKDTTPIPHNGCRPKKRVRVRK